jgi:hypothetical protein
MSGLRTLGQRRRRGRTMIIGDDGTPTIVTQPYRVIVSPHGGQSADFGSLFAPNPPRAIDHVAVFGGTRWVPRWDTTSVVWSAPSRVEVYLVGAPMPQVFTAPLDAVDVYTTTDQTQAATTKHASLLLLKPSRRSLLGAWFSGSDEAHAGIRAVRTLQALYDQVVKDHPDAAKYKVQIDPIVAGADKWDAALVFYSNDDAVELGRRAQQLSKQIAREYNQPPVADDPALAPGLLEQLPKAGERALDFATYVPWIIAIAGVLVVGGVAVPWILGALRAGRSVRA